MDPDVTFQTVCDAHEDIDTRREAAANLHEWIDSGGYVPEAALARGLHVSTLLHNLRLFAAGHDTF